MVEDVAYNVLDRQGIPRDNLGVHNHIIWANLVETDERLPPLGVAWIRYERPLSSLIEEMT
jgi:hypothetical protein